MSWYHRWDIRRHGRSLAPLVLSLLLLPSFLIASAQAMDVKKVVSPKGITAWLVEDHTLPLVSMSFGFNGGSAQDPEGQAGLAYFVSGMLDEGAGDIESQAFQETLQTLAIKMSFDANRDVLTGSFKTLTRNRDEAFRLLRLVLNEPRMDEEAVERIRQQIVASIKIDQEDPNDVASNAWFAKVFEGHPYGSPTKGTVDSVITISPADLKGFVKRTFARNNLHVAVVGDITEDELAVELDRIFGDLPEKAELKPVPDADWSMMPRQTVIPMAMPQTVVNFGMPGLKRSNEDFIPAYVMNYILGGGGFSSKLMQEVREERGLAYSVYSYMSPLDHAGIIYGGVATENSRVAESIRVIKQVLADMAKNGPTEEELEDAKRYLTGSYALRFSSSERIATILMWVQIENLGIDYIDKRNSLVEAVTLEDIKRVSQLLDPDDMIMTIVGQPEGLKPAADKSSTENASPRG